MKIKILTLVFCLMSLGSHVYSMDQNNYTSSSSSPSYYSADLEALTWQQMEKEREESELQRSSSSASSSSASSLVGDAELKRDEDNDREWYCERRFAKTNSELDFLNIFKSAIGQDQTNYSKISLCPLDNEKLAALYEAKNNFYRIRILDINTGKCTSVIDPLKDEKDSKLVPTQLCKLSENRIACILNGALGENKKIKIYDIDSGKFLKDIIVEGRFSGTCDDAIQGIYLPNNRMALIFKNLVTNQSSFILILDLTSGKTLRKIDLIRKYDRDILKEGTDSWDSWEKYIDIFGDKHIWDRAFTFIYQAIPFPDGRLALHGYGNKICIVSTDTGEVDLVKWVYNIQDISVLQNGQLINLDRASVFVTWDNEKFKFKKIQEVFNEDKSIIPDLQDIVLDYLSKNWNANPSVLKIRGEFDRLFILDENHVLGFYHATSDTELINGYCGILNVNTGKLKNIILKRDFFLKMHRASEFKILDNGKRIAFYAKDGSIEIWTNQALDK